MKIFKLRIIFFIAFISTISGKAQDVYQLWENETIPYYKENNLKEYEKEVWGTQCVFDITEPTLTIYPAKGVNTGKSVVIIPGGGFNLVALYHEGYDVAKALSAQGITAAVLKYRLPRLESSNQPHLVPLSDARQALKLLRSKSDLYNINTNKVGVLGFSAGSLLSTMVSLWKSENEDENPNFSGLIYGTNAMVGEGALKFLEKKLYYRELTTDEIAQNKLLNLVSKDTPPTFLVHAYNDETVPVSGSTLYAQKLFENKVPVEMHLFPMGGHGFGLGKEKDNTNQWVQLFVNWIKSPLI